MAKGGGRKLGRQSLMLIARVNCQLFGAGSLAPMARST